MFETLSAVGIHNHEQLSSYLAGLLICSLITLAFSVYAGRVQRATPRQPELTEQEFNALCIELREVVDFDAAGHDLVRLLTMEQRFSKRCYEWDLMVRISQSARCTDEERFLVGKYCSDKEPPTKFSGSPVINWGWFHSFRARRAVMATA